MSASIVHSQLFIDGQSRNSSAGETFEVYNPATLERVGHAESASSDDVQAAIAAAARVLPAWERTIPAEKRRILNKAADLLETEGYKKLTSELEAQETGAAPLWGYGDCLGAARQLREAAAKAAAVKGETFPSGSVLTPSSDVIIKRRPLGVIFAIAPWNAAANLAARAVAVPLVCGNTVVLKSSEVCPATHTLVVKALHEAGLPNGVLNLIHVSKESVSKIVSEIIAHPEIRHVNFTGSDRVGRIIATEAAKHLKPVVLELGGKAAAVVLDDANVKDAARAIISAAMLNSGQVCMSTERVIVQRGVSDALIKELTTLARKISAGPSSSSAQISCLVAESAAKNAVTLINEAKAGGAEVLVGDSKQDGAYVQPHIVLGVQPGMRMWEEESFGPMFGIAVVDTIDEAVNLANKTEYSLTSSLWTTSLAGVEIASRIRAGEVVINGSTLHPEPCVEIHGIGGKSGYGCFAIENFTDKRIIIVNGPGLKFPLVDF